MSNVVKQLTDPLTGDNIFPLGVMAGSHTKMTLLWTNPSPTSAFAAQTVSLDLSGYDLVQILYRQSNNSATPVSSNMCTVGDKASLFIATPESASVYILDAERRATISTTGVTFADAYMSHVTGGSSVATTYCIPLKIYGIKLNAQNIQGDPSVYSTSETVVGTWIDGKPLYRKVVSVSSVSTLTTLDSTLTSSYVDTLVNSYGTFTCDWGSGGGIVIYQLPGIESGVYWRSFITSSGFQINTNYSATSYVIDLTMTIEYTKN